MKLNPTYGIIFVVAVDKIDPPKDGMGFGTDKQKHKAEVPYRFKVVAVGGKLPLEGLWIDSPVKIGDVISLNHDNANMRERIASGAGFLLDEIWHYPIDFRDVLGVWNEEIDLSIN